MGYNGYTEKKKITNQRYAAQFERPHLRISKENKLLIEKAAAIRGMSFNAFVIEAALKEAQNVAILHENGMK